MIEKNMPAIWPKVSFSCQRISPKRTPKVTEAGLKIATNPDWGAPTEYALIRKKLPILTRAPTPIRRGIFFSFIRIDLLADVRRWITTSTIEPKKKA